MPQALSVRKKAWVDHFKPDALRGEPLVPDISAAYRYYARIARLIERMATTTEQELKKLFNEPHAKEYFAQDASVSAQARILTNEIARRFEDLFALNAKPLAEQMAEEADKSSAVSVQGSIAKLSGGLSIGRIAATGDLSEILSATVTENVALIKSIASQYLSAVQGAVMRSITTGNGLQDLQPFLQKYKGITLRRAQLISLDQTRKAYQGLSRGRLERLGVTQGEWRHSGGSHHPRKSHIAMSGKTFTLSQGLYDSEVKRNVKPGELPYCRCFFTPIIKFD